MNARYPLTYHVKNRRNKFVCGKLFLPWKEIETSACLKRFMKNDLVLANTPIHIFINIDYSFCSWQLAAFRSHEKIEWYDFKHLLRELADRNFSFWQQWYIQAFCIFWPFVIYQRHTAVRILRFNITATNRSFSRSFEEKQRTIETVSLKSICTFN